MDERAIEKIVRQVLAELKGESSPIQATVSFADSGPKLPDLREHDLYSWTSVPEPIDEEGVRMAAGSTPARIGVWRSGPRPKVDHWLRFRADHAAANDAVLREVPKGLFDDLGYFEVLSQAQSKDDYLTRPDLGRLLSDEAFESIRAHCPMGAEVQIVVADGLSSLAVERNAPEFIPAFEEVVKSYGLRTGQGFFVRHGRVGIMNAVGELLAPEVLLLLIGERPGLVTAESMSAYICYKPTQQTIESDRSLVSNIHPGGIPAIEAAAHVAELVRTIREARASGLNLRKA